MLVWLRLLANRIAGRVVGQATDKDFRLQLLGNPTDHSTMVFDEKDLLAGQDERVHDGGRLKGALIEFFRRKLTRRTGRLL